MFSLFQKDAVEFLNSLNNESIDLLITDPPYESLEKHRKKGTTTRLKHSKSSSNDWFQIFPNERFEEFFRLAFSKMKKNAHFYLFCDQETMFVVKSLAEKVGFHFWKPLIWDKVTIGMGYHYRSRYELILFFEKGKKKLQNLGIPDILEFKRIRGGYPTEKPFELMQVLVKQSSLEGEVVVDPFCGSGSVGEASLKLGRVFYGSDISSKAFELTSQRLSSILPEVTFSKPENVPKQNLEPRSKPFQEKLFDSLNP